MKVRHDVMAHVYTYGKRPLAAGIIHLGPPAAMSPTTDLIIYREMLRYLGKLLAVVAV